MDASECVIPIDDRLAWEKALAGVPHAFGHSWTSCHAMQQSTGGPTYLYRCRSAAGSLLCPFAERSFGGQVDITTPYGFAGFTGDGDMRSLLPNWTRFARERGYVCGYIGLNPLLIGNIADCDDVEYRQELFFLDLAKDAGDLLAGMKRGRRRQILRWQEEGSPLITDRAMLSSFFIDHFDAFMESRGAARAYAMPEKTLSLLMASSCSILLGAGSAGVVEAALLLCHSPTIGESMFSVALDGVESYDAQLVWAGALELKKRDVRWLSLGGGIHPGDGVAEFKRRWGGEVKPMPCIRQIYEPEVFGRLCELAGVDQHDRSGYFPPYYQGRI